MPNYKWFSEANEDFCGWIAPDGGLFSKTLTVRTHEHLALIILESIYGVVGEHEHPHYIMLTNKDLIDLGWIRYDHETVWTPNRQTDYQITAMSALRKINGYVPTERFSRVFRSWKNLYPELEI